LHSITDSTAIEAVLLAERNAMRKILKDAFNLMFCHDGGYVKNPNDVTPAQVVSLSDDEATEIYRRYY